MIPFLPGQNARDDIKRDQPFRIAAFAINREGHADAAKQKFRLLALAFQLGDRRHAQPARNFGIGRAQLRRLPHFVKGVNGFSHQRAGLLLLRASAQSTGITSQKSPRNSAGGAHLPRLLALPAQFLGRRSLKSRGGVYANPSRAGRHPPPPAPAPRQRGARPIAAPLADRDHQNRRGC